MLKHTEVSHVNVVVICRIENIDNYISSAMVVIVAVRKSIVKVEVIYRLINFIHVTSSSSDNTFAIEQKELSSAWGDSLEVGVKLPSIGSLNR